MGFLSGLGSAMDIAGGLIGSNGQAEANRQNQAFANQMWKQNYEAQKEFAQNGIRWRVEDAKSAGLHPIFAMGASGASYSPVNASSYYENESSGLGNTLSNMGQNIGRAAQAKMTREERVLQDLQQQELFDLDVRQKEADIALTNAQISAITSRNQQQVPPMPSNSRDSFISGQSDSSFYPTGETEKKPIEVLTSAPGSNGGAEAGGNPVYAWSKTPDGWRPRINDAEQDTYSESKISKMFFWADVLSDVLAGRLSPPEEPRPGFVWKFFPASRQFREVRANQYFKW